MKRTLGVCKLPDVTGDMFDLVDEPIICRIMEFLAMYSKVPACDRMKDLLALAATCRRLRKVAMCADARGSVWPLLDLGAVLALQLRSAAEVRRICATTLGGVAFGYARRMIIHDTVGGGAQPLVAYNTTALQDLTLIVPACGIPYDLLHTVASLPALRRLDIDGTRALTNPHVWVDVSACPVETLTLTTLPDVGFRGEFPRVRRLTLYAMRAAEMEQRMGRCPIVEELCLPSLESVGPFDMLRLCTEIAKMGRLRRLEMVIRRGDTPGIADMLRSTLGRLGVLKLSISEGHPSTAIGVCEAAAEAISGPSGGRLLRKLSLAYGTPTPEDVMAIGGFVSLESLSLGHTAHSQFTSVGDALECIGRVPGARKLDVFRLESLCLDTAILATPRFGSLRKLVLTSHPSTTELVVPDSLADSLRVFRCTDGYAPATLYPILRACWNLEELVYTTRAGIDALPPSQPKAAQPFDVTVHGAYVTDAFLRTVSDRLRVLVVHSSSLRGPQMALIMANSLASLHPDLRAITLLRGTGDARYTETRWATRGNRPLVTIDA